MVTIVGSCFFGEPYRFPVFCAPNQAEIMGNHGNIDNSWANLEKTPRGVRPISNAGSKCVGMCFGKEFHESCVPKRARVTFHKATKDS